MTFISSASLCSYSCSNASYILLSHNFNYSIFVAQCKYFFYHSAFSTSKKGNVVISTFSLTCSFSNAVLIAKLITGHWRMFKLYVHSESLSAMVLIVLIHITQPQNNLSSYFRHHLYHLSFSSTFSFSSIFKRPIFMETKLQPFFLTEILTIYLSNYFDLRY